MDRYTQERYGPLARKDLDAEAWPWRAAPRTDTPQDIARRRRLLWLALKPGGEADELGKAA